MSNCYTRFAVRIKNVTEREREWLELHLIEGLQGDLPADSWLRRMDRAIRRRYEDPHAQFPNFQWMYEREGGVLLYADESGDPGDAAHLLRAFLRRWRPDDYFAFAWVSYEDYDDEGNHEGGALYVDARKIRWMNTGNWMDRMAEKYARKA